MTIVRTNLGTVESARRIRVEPVNRITATDVQNALQGLDGRITSTDSASIVYIIDGGGSAIASGIKGYLEITFPCTINSVQLLADQSGSIIVDIYKCTTAQFDGGITHPVVGDKITSSTPPTLTSAVKETDTTLSGWTTAISAGDVLGFNVNALATSITRVTLTLGVTKTA